MWFLYLYCWHLHFITSSIFACCCTTKRPVCVSDSCTFIYKGKRLSGHIPKHRKWVVEGAHTQGGWSVCCANGDLLGRKGILILSSSLSATKQLHVAHTQLLENIILVEILSQNNVFLMLAVGALGGVSLYLPHPHHTAPTCSQTRGKFSLLGFSAQVGSKIFTHAQ